MSILKTIIAGLKETIDATIEQDSRMVKSIMRERMEAVKRGEIRASEMRPEVGYTKAFDSLFFGYGSPDSKYFNDRVNEVVTKNVNKKIANTIATVTKKLDGEKIVSVKSGPTTFSGSMFTDAGFQWVIETENGDKVVHFRAIWVSGDYVRPHTRVILTTRKA